MKSSKENTLRNFPPLVIADRNIVLKAKKLKATLQEVLHFILERSRLKTRLDAST